MSRGAVCTCVWLLMPQLCAGCILIRRFLSKQASMAGICGIWRDMAGYGGIWRDKKGYKRYREIHEGYSKKIGQIRRLTHED